MNVLVVGVGVIGTVYGATLANHGHTVSVLQHGHRSEDVAARGFIIKLAGGESAAGSVASLVADAAVTRYDLVLVCVRAENLGAACDALRGVQGSPTLLFFGNNPAGRSGLPVDLPGSIHLGFPGIGGALGDGGVVEYVRIPQQPTTLGAGGGPAVDEFAATLISQGFPVTRTANMNGWLAYHSVFVACIAAAIYRCGGSAERLGNDRGMLSLLCRAIEQGFHVLSSRGTSGLPRNLRALHQPLLRPFAARYWGRTLRSPMGESCFAAHARHAEPEMRLLASKVLELADGAAGSDYLRSLLTTPGRMP